MAVGFNPQTLHNDLFKFQKDIVSWACRRGLGIELKPSYFKQASKNLKEAKNTTGTLI